MSDENCVGRNTTAGGRSFFSACLFGHVLFTSVLKASPSRNRPRDFKFGILVASFSKSPDFAEFATVVVALLVRTQTIIKPRPESLQAAVNAAGSAALGGPSYCYLWLIQCLPREIRSNSSRISRAQYGLTILLG